MTAQRQRYSGKARVRFALKIQSHLLGLGYGVPVARILNKYAMFKRWHEGNLTIGHLEKMAGISRNVPTESE